MTSPIVSATSIFSIMAAVGITLCPAWMTDQSGNLRGPLFSIIDGSWVITSLPANFACFIAATYLSGNHDARIVIARYLTALGAIMVSIMAQPGLKLVPLFPSFFMFLVLILTSLFVMYFPSEKPNIMQFPGAQCMPLAKVKDDSHDKKEVSEEEEDMKILREYEQEMDDSDNDSDHELEDVLISQPYMSFANNYLDQLDVGGRSPDKYDILTQTIREGTYNPATDHAPFAAPIGDSTIPGSWRGITIADE